MAGVSRAIPSRAGGFLYFIQAKEGGPIKIGYSATEAGVLERLKGMQTGNPSDLVLRNAFPGTALDERRLHRELEEWRVRGEWFLPVEPVLRRCDLLGVAKVGNKGLSLAQVDQVIRRERRNAVIDVVLVLEDVLEQVEEIAASGEFDADSLAAALADRLGRFVDTHRLADAQEGRG